VATKVHTPGTASASTGSPDCLSDSLGWLLVQAKQALGREFELALEPLGLSARSYHVLASALGKTHTQIELANLVGLDKTTMVATIDALEKDGLAERCPSSSDRRVRVIAVTEEGARKVREGRKIVDQVQADVLARLPAHERRALLSGLSRLISS
jgi:MarR family transcriptional regulator, transcriptional regulator for hemolysin